MKPAIQLHEGWIARNKKTGKIVVVRTLYPDVNCASVKFDATWGGSIDITDLEPVEADRQSRRPASGEGTRGLSEQELYDLALEKLGRIDGKVTAFIKALSGKLRVEEHCQDCCCAKSWKALGITKYTGKSIPEEINALQSRLIDLARIQT